VEILAGERDIGARKRGWKSAIASHKKQRQPGASSIVGLFRIQKILGEKVPGGKMIFAKGLQVRIAPRVRFQVLLKKVPRDLQIGGVRETA